jgi:hypothetical protein
MKKSTTHSANGGVAHLAARTGQRVERKRDGATGTIEVSESFTRGVRFPFKTIITVRFDDSEVQRRAGGPSVGDLSWFRSNYREER